MSLKSKVEKLEAQARDVKATRLVEFNLPWGDGETIRLVTSPETVKSIVRIYGNPGEPRHQA